jgi:low affinity Fe/Cu permease
MKSGSLFTRFAKWTSRAAGRPGAFVVAAGVIVVRGITGPVFKYSDTPQLVIYTGTTVVTFLMVFLTQNTRHRDTGALQIKLDELIRVTEGAHLVLLDLEELNETHLERIRANYEKLAARARADLKLGKVDTATPDVDDCGA